MYEIENKTIKKKLSLTSYSLIEIRLIYWVLKNNSKPINN